MIYVLIAGIDRYRLGYYRHELAAEQALVASGVRYSMVGPGSLTFIDLVFGVAPRVPLVMPLPAGFEGQSVVIEDVAAHLLDVLRDGPGALLPAMAALTPCRSCVPRRYGRMRVACESP